MNNNTNLFLILTLFEFPRSGGFELDAFPQSIASRLLLSRKGFELTNLSKIYKDIDSD